MVISNKNTNKGINSQIAISKTRTTNVRCRWQKNQKKNVPGKKSYQNDYYDGPDNGKIGKKEKVITTNRIKNSFI